MDGFARWVRTVGRHALCPCLALMFATGLAAHYGLLQGFWLRAAAGILFALIMTMPLSLIWVGVPGETWVEKRLRLRWQHRNRQELAAAGLTPEQYLGTIPAHDVMRRIKAAWKFGIDQK